MGRTELEFKYVLDRLPVNMPAHCTPIQQGYVELKNPAIAQRLRRKGNKLVLEFKMDAGQVGQRFETEELDLSDSSEIFNGLWETCLKGNGLEKDRYQIDVDPTVAKEIIIDVFRGNLRGRIFLEIEFNDLAQRDSWQVPEWISQLGFRDVTGLKQYNNESLAIHGWPED